MESTISGSDDLPDRRLSKCLRQFLRKGLYLRLILFVLACVLGLGIGLVGLRCAVLETGILIVLMIAISRRAQDNATQTGWFILLGFVVLGRGFSHVGIQIASVPLYVGELAVVLTGLALIRCKRKSGQLEATAVLLSLWALWAASHLPGDIATHGLFACRDFSLVYYAVLFGLGYLAYHEESAARRSHRFLFVALIVHLVYTGWFLFGGFFQGAVLLPDGVSLFSYRWDFDGVMLSALTVSVFALAEKRRLENRWWLLGALLPLVVIMSMGSRAALLAWIFCVLLIGLRKVYRFRFYTLLSAVCVISIMMGVIGLALPLTDRFGSDFASNPIDMAQAAVVTTVEDIINERASTTTFRVQWWTALIEQVFESPRTALYGLGFGESLNVGGSFIVGDDTTGNARSPHNGYLSVLVRTGLVGLVIWVAAVIYAVRAGFSMLSSPLVAPITRWQAATLLSIAIGMLVAGAVGVLFESPFSAAWLYASLGGLTALSQQALGDSEVREGESTRDFLETKICES